MKKIKGVIKNYAWGGPTYLQSLLNLAPDDNQTWAEYWLGTHADGEAQLEEGTKLSTYLHTKKIKSLPFQMKVLDVKDMLSIQVHPNKSQAEKGFDYEEANGIAPKAYHRTYKDRNHKPELMVALSDFWLLQGFKTDVEIQETLEKNSELSILLPVFGELGLKAMYEKIMLADQDYINEVLKPLGKRIKPLFEAGELAKSDINFWAARAFLTFNRKGFCDRGILSLYLMNLLHLQPGEGTFQAPGVLHAYLEGQNIECMATSDNVIRGGLTQKHIDQKALLEIVEFAQGQLPIIRPTEHEHYLYEYPPLSEEFTLRTLKGQDTKTSITEVPAIILCLKGHFECTTNEGTLRLDAGESIISTEKCNIVSCDNSYENLLVIASSW